MYKCRTPKGWFKSGAYPQGYGIGLDAKVSQHGKKSAFIKSYQPKDFCTLMQAFNDSVYSDKRVKLTGYIKTQGRTDTARMWVRIDDLDNKIFADFDNMDNRPIIGTNEWKQYDIIFDVPESKCNIYFGVILSGTGKLWMDNFVFEIVDKSTNKTASNIGTPLPQDFIKTENYGKHLNLDFED